MSVRVALISSYDVAGGAALAAYRLHHGLKHRGLDSKVVVRRRFSDNQFVVEHCFDEGQIRFDMQVSDWQEAVIAHCRCGRSNTLFSLPYPGFDISQFLNSAAVDIINLHWVNRFQSIESINCLLDSGKPVVWTLHDQWPFTGGCHYSDGCTGYERACTACPQLHTLSQFIPPVVLRAKQINWSQRMTVVSPSHWLAGCARRSAVFANSRIEVIPNGIDTSLFVPSSKVEAKRILGLPPDGLVLLFTANGLLERRKGFDLLLAALRQAMTFDIVRRRVMDGTLTLLIAGGGAVTVPDCGWPVRLLGLVKSDTDMAAAYRAADLLLLASLEDNLPNTMLEAMSCGTPVLGFDVGGIGDVVRDGQNGFLVQSGNVDEYTRIMCEQIRSGELSRMGLAARDTILAEYSLDRQAVAYHRLFDELSNSESPRSVNSRCKSITSRVIESLQESFAPFSAYLVVYALQIQLAPLIEFTLYA